MNIKKDKIKPRTMIKTFYRQEPGVELPNIQNNVTGGSFNQTIIINNPNININYHEQNNRIDCLQDQAKYQKQQRTYNQTNYQFKLQQADLYNPQSQAKEVKGIQLWALNKNLKQFSETRQKGFYKNNDKPIISPYAIHRNRTQQIRPINKVYSNNTMQTIDRSKSKNTKISIPLKLEQRSRTISTVKKQTLTPLNNSFYETINSKKKFRNRMIDYTQKTPRQVLSDKKIQAFDPYLKTFINAGQLKRQNSNSQIEICQTDKKHQAIHSGRKTQTYMQGNIRKNKFQGVFNFKQVEQKKPEVELSNLSYQIQPSSLNKTDDQHYQIDEQFRSNSSPSGAYDLNRKQQQKRRNYGYGKAIQKINKLVLKKQDEYLDSFSYSSIPSSKIDFYLNSLKQPDCAGIGHSDYKSIPNKNVRQEYNFLFDEQKKKNRPITPYKRKKIYEIA